ncbi:unnamed protein product [Strongylus vulgaris]|uniref:Uncharacterized protein n=1 Tax=Strongylus vulgaris TaxID=40348 RepID=A0A3P7J905_STRVU|nr:unnamed protein product [Strongylus vulgaris]
MDFDKRLQCNDRIGCCVILYAASSVMGLQKNCATLAAHVVPAYFICCIRSDLLKSLYISEDKILYEWLPALVTAYGGFGCIVSALSFFSPLLLAFFYHGAPLLLHQFFVLSNCSLVSLFYLRSFPGHTAWFVLWCVALWGK